jgi:hypothetical protein
MDVNFVCSHVEPPVFRVVRAAWVLITLAQPVFALIHHMRSPYACQE